MSYTTQLGLTDWELEQAKLDELYSYDENEPWWQRQVRVTNNKLKACELLQCGTLPKS